VCSSDLISHQICEANGVPHERDAPVGPLTWYRVGGAADVLAHPQSVQQLARLLRACAEQQIPLRLLGRGANVIVADRGVRGVVVQLDAPAFCEISVVGTTVTAGGGADLAKFIMTCVRGGLAGPEVLAGIPGTVGGAVRMNAGGRFGEIGPLVEQVHALGWTGQVVAHRRDDIDFGYRRSHLGEPVIVQVEFALRRGNPDSLRSRVKEYFRWKGQSQPLGGRSAGCAFKNPPRETCEEPAGRLIDEAGLKGRRIGGAEVSPVHANFIVIHPGGTADDAIRLMDHVRQRVAERFGVNLEREFVVWADEQPKAAP